MSKKKIFTTLNHIEHLLILFFAVTGCVSISAFAFAPIDITSSAERLKFVQ